MKALFRWFTGMYYREICRLAPPLILAVLLTGVIGCVLDGMHKLGAGPFGTAIVMAFVVKLIAHVWDVL